MGKGVAGGIEVDVNDRYYHPADQKVQIVTAHERHQIHENIFFNRLPFREFRAFRGPILPWAGRRGVLVI